MDSSEHSSSNQQTIISSSDWDQPFTALELEEIDAIFQSATSSSLSSRTDTCPSAGKSTGDCDDHRPKTRRRLPDSLFGFRDQSRFTDKLSSECSPMGISNSFSLLPCPRNRFYSQYHSSCEAKLKMRFPAMTFGGRIIYSRTASQVEKAAEELLKFVEAKKRDMGRAIIGFDIEWKPTFRKGVPPGKAAVMQICVDPSHCHVMHIIHSGFPQNLRSLLGDPNSVKVGVGIANDARKVFKDHNVSVEALGDLSFLANQKLGGEPKNWSLKSLTERLICKQLPKPSKIRLGNWEAFPLSKEQLKYAATDAYVSWYLYEVLNRLLDAAAVDKSELVENVSHS